MGCLKGCLDFLDLEISDGWLYGGTGHAFLLNMHDQVCPSGPTAWKGEPLLRLGRNLGYEVETVMAFKSDGVALEEGQRGAWTLVREAVNEGKPCFGWELESPEYYVVYGYDQAGYYFSGPGCDDGNGPKPWTELGDSGIGVLEMYRVDLGSSASDTQVLEESLTFALIHAADTGRWVLPHYTAGLAGYETWVDALRNGRAEAVGMAYNAAVWNECRGYAVQFLQEAQERLRGSTAEMLTEAISHYRAVFDRLTIVADLFPFHGLDPEHLKDESRVSRAIDALQAARKAEAQGLESLRAVVASL
jgi:hypothetical protein